jgi:phage-related protein (TIGR01555 family)
MDWRKLFQWRKEKPEPLSVVPKGDGLRRAASKAGESTRKSYNYPVKTPDIMPRVVPVGAKAAIAMDENAPNFFSASLINGGISGFPGYPHLSFLATRAEYRAMAGALSTEITREWITINSSETAGESTKNKVTEITKKIEDIGLQQVIQRAAEHDAYFGRAQILIDIKGHDASLPLVLSPKTIKKDTFNKVTTVEAIWTTPASYNALDPAAPDFYRPAKWFMLGKEVHASRLLTIITRPLPDMLKPAFNFGGMSLSQLAEPYVDNWLRTRQSVSDLINNFSITALATSMDQVLDGTSDGEDLFARAALFTAARSNRGLMLLDKDREELVQVNTPLSGLHELQAQSQEHMCAVSRLPAIILTGISPSGLNASSEGEIKTFFDWISAQQEAYWRKPVDTIFKVLQLSMYGEIDPDITFSFDPLYQMTPKELAEIRTADSTTAGNYIDRGVLDPSEVREKLARDSESGYQGLDLSLEITNPNLEDEEDDEDKE